MSTQVRLARRDFPISYNDTLSVRDGDGRIVERWRFVHRTKYDADKDQLYFDVEHVR